MKIDETFEGVNRLWQEISVIVLIHAVAVALAMYAHLIPIRTVSEGIGAFTTLPELTTVRANLQRIGLDLPFVVITGIIVYIVLFQKFSEAAVGIAVFRLSHSGSLIRLSHMEQEKHYGRMPDFLLQDIL